MGYLYVMTAAVFFGIIPTIEEMLIKSGLPSNLIAVEMMAVGCVLAGIAAAIRGESFRVSLRLLPALLLGGAVGRGLTEICLVRAYASIPAGMATMVHFLFPAVVCLAETAVFHEAMTRRKAVAIALSAAGLLGLAGGVSGGSLAGIAAAGASSLSFAFYYLLTERSGLRELPPMVMIFWVHLIAVAETAALVTAESGWMPLRSGMQLLGVAAAGGICFAGYVCLNRGIPMIGADTAGFINMLEPVTSVMMSVIVYHITLSVPAVLGCCLILAVIPVRSLPVRLRS